MLWKRNPGRGKYFASLLLLFSFSLHVAGEVLERCISFYLWNVPDSSSMFVPCGFSLPKNYLSGVRLDIWRPFSFFFSTLMVQRRMVKCVTLGFMTFLDVTKYINMLCWQTACVCVCVRDQRSTALTQGPQLSTSTLWTNCSTYWTTGASLEGENRFFS